ncbi:DUF930 domain-containing protein [Labrys okinawensis]|uniref:DUF930 domain-containing protein n=1 Tax=Labrys okinawensis TaxID=346911 RepID=UPI0039BC4779
MLAAIAMHVLAAVLILPLSLVSPLKEEQVITVELVPEPKPPEPKPPEPKPPEKPKTQAPPPVSSPQPEKPPEATAPITPPTNASSAPQGQAYVLKFGDKDAGPRKSPGQNAESGAAAPAGLPDLDRHGLSWTLAVTTDAPDQIPQGAPAKAAKPGDGAQIKPDSALREATTLFSQDATNDVSSMMAMGSTSRGQRVGNLCFSELGAQLLYSSPPYTMDMGPRLSLPEGTVLEAPHEAFHANSTWYEVSFRCEVDAQATKVVSFAFRVGKPIPRSEWASRRLPSE